MICCLFTIRNRFFKYIVYKQSYYCSQITMKFTSNPYFKFLPKIPRRRKKTFREKESFVFRNTHFCFSNSSLISSVRGKHRRLNVTEVWTLCSTLLPHHTTPHRCVPQHISVTLDPGVTKLSINCSSIICYTQEISMCNTHYKCHNHYSRLIYFKWWQKHMILLPFHTVRMWCEASSFLQSV